MPSLLPSSSLSGALWDRVRGLGSSLSSRLSETAAVLPSYVHFGRHHVAPTVGVAPAGIKLPVRCLLLILVWRLMSPRRGVMMLQSWQAVCAYVKGF